MNCSTIGKVANKPDGKIVQTSKLVLDGICVQKRLPAQSDSDTADTELSLQQEYANVHYPSAGDMSPSNAYRHQHRNLVCWPKPKNSLQEEIAWMLIEGRTGCSWIRQGLAVEEE